MSKLLTQVRVQLQRLELVLLRLVLQQRQVRFLWPQVPWSFHWHGPLQPCSSLRLSERVLYLAMVLRSRVCIHLGIRTCRLGIWASSPEVSAELMS